MRTYEIIKRAIALRGRDIQEVAVSIGTSREHLSRYVNGRSPNFAQALLDKLFEELGLKLVLTFEDIDVLPDEKGAPTSRS
ncbi:MAG: helix-turn-helix transcriptional regulator [Cyanobacteria bacterium J06607_10]